MSKNVATSNETSCKEYPTLKGLQMLLRHVLQENRREVYLFAGAKVGQVNSRWSKRCG